MVSTKNSYYILRMLPKATGGNPREYESTTAGKLTMDWKEGASGVVFVC
jgi:hypothetical protein